MPNRRTVAIGVVVIAAFALGGQARGDEGGVPFWLSGQYASFAAVPQKPGFYLASFVWYDNGTASQSRTFQRGGLVTAGLEISTPVLYLAPTFVPDVKILRGRPAFSVAFGGGYNSTTADIVGPIGTMAIHQTDTAWGITDLFPLINLSWASGVHNGMGYVTGAIPVGSYRQNRLANIGIGHGAIDFGGGYTYLTPKSDLEVSGVTGFTFNFENSSTNYTNGTDWHLDWALSQFLSKSLHVGVVGYLYVQVTGDSGSGDRDGAFKSDVASAGGQAGYFFNVAGQQWYANVRGYAEFWAVHRARGVSLFGALNIPLAILQ